MKEKIINGEKCKLVLNEDGYQVWEPYQSVDERVMFFEEEAGERIQEWLEGLTIKDGFKRIPTNEDIALFESEGDIAWVFTERGQKLYESYLSKVTRLGSRLFPGEELDIDCHTGVFNP